MNVISNNNYIVKISILILITNDNLFFNKFQNKYRRSFHYIFVLMFPKTLRVCGYPIFSSKLFYLKLSFF